MFQFLLVFLKCFFLFFIAFSRPVLTNFQLRCLFLFFILFFFGFCIYFLRFQLRFSRQLFQFYLFAFGVWPRFTRGKRELCRQLWQLATLATGDWRLHLLSWQSANSSRESWPINMGGRPFLWQSNALFNSN